MISITRLSAVATICVTLALGTRYHVDAQQDQAVLDENMHLLSFADLDYPQGARAARLQGVVVIAATLDDSGNVVSTAAVSGHRYLIPDAAANAKKWKFKPNRQKRVIIIYDFQIESGGCHDRTRSLFLLQHGNFATIKSCENVIEG